MSNAITAFLIDDLEDESCRFFVPAFLSVIYFSPLLMVKSTFMAVKEMTNGYNAFSRFFEHSSKLMQEDVCRSGGAAGTDILFGEYASRLGHKVIHYSFAGFEAQAKSRDSVILRKLTPYQLQEADGYLLRANATLKKEFPCGIEYRDNVLRRNWWIVRSVDTIYAVCRLDLKNQQPIGNVAFAIQCLIDRASIERHRMRAYVFDQSRSKWYRFDFVRRVWIAIPAHRVPVPRGDYAGLGIAKLMPEGERAIAQLFRLSTWPVVN